jgi:hypothetical protein
VWLAPFINCCTAIYLIWLAYNQLPPSCRGSILPASSLIAVPPFLIWLVHFLIAMPSHLHLAHHCWLAHRNVFIGLAHLLIHS